jgi:hypothetical protein
MGPKGKRQSGLADFILIFGLGGGSTRWRTFAWGIPASVRIIGLGGNVKPSEDPLKRLIEQLFLLRSLK